MKIRETAVQSDFTMSLVFMHTAFHEVPIISDTGRLRPHPETRKYPSGLHSLPQDLSSEHFLVESEGGIEVGSKQMGMMNMVLHV